MTIEEAIKVRHTVRKYTSQKIPAEIAKELNMRLSGHNKKYNLRMRLVTDNTKAFGPVLKLFLAKGVRNYIVLAGKDATDTDEKLGYCGIDTALFAQTLGLNSWWIGGTYSRKKVKETIGAAADEKLYGIIAIGYGMTQGVPHKSKKAEDIGSYNGMPPDWFVNGVEAVLLAPTALNKQAFSIKGDGDTVSILCSNGAFSGIDLGIAKYHFEIGAGRDNFKWVPA